MALLLITHDLGVVAEHRRPRGRDVRRADRRAGAGADHLRDAAAPLHAGPARARCRASTPRQTPICRAIAGIGAAACAALPPGCRFRSALPAVRSTRCAARRRRRRGRSSGGPQRRRCHRPLRRGAAIAATGDDRRLSAPLLEVDATCVKHFPIRGGVFAGAGRRRCTPSTASSSTSHAGETLGLVGESGCGKIDHRRGMVLRLIEPTGGRRSRFDGRRSCCALARGRAARLRREHADRLPGSLRLARTRA